MTLKPAATSEFSLLCVLAQPATRASSARILKELIDRLFGELMEAKPGLAKDLMSLFFGEMTTRLMHHCYGNGID